MIYRKIVSLTILLSFIVLMISGILEYLFAHTSGIAALHTIFGALFSIGIILHFLNNFPAIKTYLKSRWVIIPLVFTALIVTGAYLETPPFNKVMSFGSKLRATQKQEVDLDKREVIEMNMDGETQLSLDLIRGEHYWHPQMAIWVEDSTGNFIQTVFISRATAEGLFFGGRSKENFKTFDEETDASGDYRRVDALPVWSHKRNIKYDDGMYVPPNYQPIVDGTSGPTISESFLLKTSVNDLEKFRVRVEINVAFDDNEFYSEFDFPDDDIYHSGTGQLGQPSIIFEAEVDTRDGQNYYLMNLIGHGHRSGQTGELYTDLSTLTTAKHIVERIVLGVKKQ